MSVRSQSGSLIIVHGNPHLKHAAVRKSPRTGRIEALQESDSRCVSCSVCGDGSTGINCNRLAVEGRAIGMRRNGSNPSASHALSLLFRGNRSIVLRLILLLSCGLTCCACNPSKPPKKSIMTAEMRFGECAASMIDGISSIPTIERSGTLYRGLPDIHSPEYKVEKQRDDAAVVHGDDFYDHPIGLQEETNASLRKILGTIESFNPRSLKECDGFHADWAVVWNLEGEEIRFHLCFGCGEARIFYRGCEASCDLEPVVDKQLFALLRPYKGVRFKQ